MTIITDLTADDLAAVVMQPAQAGEAGGMAVDALLAGPGWAARDASGRVLACGGFAPIYPGHFYAWAHLAEGKRHALVAITRRALWWLNGSGWRRVTAYARADWPEAHRWIAVLGFSTEGFLPAYGPQGEDYLVFGRVRRADDVG